MSRRQRKTGQELSPAILAQSQLARIAVPPWYLPECAPRTTTEVRTDNYSETLAEIMLTAASVFKDMNDKKVRAAALL